jgi:hypothetical protein
MTNNSSLLVALILTTGTFQAGAGTIFYQAIPAGQSDANCGISSNNQYTSAVDGGNTRGTDRVINGITLYAMVANGQSSTADNCTLNALSGNLSNAAGASASIKADGICKEVLSDMTFNNGAGDNSQQEIVLDPDSLESGTTYDLRVYVCNSAGQNRQVNLSFVGDGQAAVETGFFNEDDAKTSAGGFSDANQVYYIDYRFTWDGDSTPGITITQKSGSAPFCLYALTNQVVSAGGAAAGGGGEGLTSGLVNEESDQVGVASDDFYNSESLNNNGRWVKLDRWGTCWQPTTVASGWCPYTNGNWRECDDCGWTFVSDEPWAWCCYHYGRWCKVRTGCGWAWVPGKVWAASWVSWRQGRDEKCSCIGWAPLPPEAGCEINVGISSWVDRTCDIGPDCYTFVNIRDFGSDSYFGCGCIYEHSRNVTIIIDTFNCTNIYYGRGFTFCGGPDYNWCNERIRKFGGKEVTKIYVNRYDDPSKIKGGKFSQREGNQLALLSPHVKGEKNPKHNPKIAEALGSDKIDKGWGNVKDKKAEKELRNHIAEESKGKDPKTAKATLSPEVAQKLGKYHGSAAAGGPGPITAQQGGKGDKAKGVNAQSLTTGGQAAGGFNQHPGKGHKGQNAAGAGNANALGAQTTGGGATTTGDGGQHPGHSLKGSKKTQGGAGPTGAANAGAGTGAAGNAQGGGGGQHPGKHKGKAAQVSGQTGQGGGTQGAGGTGAGVQGTSGQAGGGQGAGGQGRHHNKQHVQTQGQTVQGGGQGVQAGGAPSGGQGTQGGGTSSGGQGGGKVHHKQQNQQYQQSQTRYGQGAAGAAGGSHHNQQQLQSSQQQQQGGKKKRGTPTPPPY